MKYQQDYKLTRDESESAKQLNVIDDDLFRELLIKLVKETPMEAWKGEAKLSFTKVDPATFRYEGRTPAQIEFVNKLKAENVIYFNVTLYKP